MKNNEFEQSILDLLNLYCKTETKMQKTSSFHQGKSARKWGLPKNDHTSVSYFEGSPCYYCIILDFNKQIIAKQTLIKISHFLGSK